MSFDVVLVPLLLTLNRIHTVMVSPLLTLKKKMPAEIVGDLGESITFLTATGNEYLNIGVI